MFSREVVDDLEKRLREAVSELDEIKVDFSSIFMLQNTLFMR